MSTSMQHMSGTLLNASPPSMRAMLIDGRSNMSDDSRLNGRVSMRRNASCDLRIALSPSHGVDPWAAVPDTSTRTASTPFACTPMWRSVGSPVSAKSARRPSATSASVERLSTSSDSSSGTHRKRHPDPVLLGRLADRAHDRGERALHVVGAAADEAVALDARLELALAGGHDVEVAVEDHGRPLARADVGHDDREAVEVALATVDVARLEPALDERGRRAQRLGLRRVVPHEALCEDPLIHVPEDRVGP